MIDIKKIQIIDNIYLNSIVIPPIIKKRIIIIFTNLVEDDYLLWQKYKIKNDINKDSPFDLAVWLKICGISYSICKLIIQNNICYYTLKEYYNLNIKNVITNISDIYLFIEIIKN
tara:strand:+ start:4494 stop:4838 length:345 start_codon:yes stop_codon:yes gene_type:complete